MLLACFSPFSYGNIALRRHVEECPGDGEERERQHGQNAKIEALRWRTAGKKTQWSMD